MGLEKTNQCATKWQNTSNCQNLGLKNQKYYVPVKKLGGVLKIFLIAGEKNKMQNILHFI